MRFVFFVLTLAFFVPTIYAQTKNQNIVAQTEAPVLLDKPGNSYVMTEAEYKAFIERFSNNPNFIQIKRKPKNTSANARFGINLVVNRKNIGWILEGDEEKGFTLHADWNADGDLTNDAPVKFRKTNDAFSGSYKTMLTETIGDRIRKYTYSVKLEVAKIIPPGKTNAELVLKSSDSTLRSGKLNLNNNQIAFGLTGWGGLYDDDNNKLYFDLSGDGKFDTETLYSAEVYKVSEKYVNIGDKTYQFSVDRYGDNLTLKPLSEKMPDRADLSPGNAAPDLSFKDLDGNSHRLSDLRGRIVLLDFWGLWCAPCVAEAPNLAAAYKRLKEKGFEVVSFDKGDTIENLRKFTAQKQMNWTHSQTDEAILRLYRIDRFPTYFLLDKDGKIISNSMRPGEEMYKKVEEILEN